MHAGRDPRGRGGLAQVHWQHGATNTQGLGGRVPAEALLGLRNRLQRGPAAHAAPARKMLLVKSWNRWSLKRQYGESVNRPAVSICISYTPGKNRLSKAAMLVTPPVTPSS